MAARRLLLVLVAATLAFFAAAPASAADPTASSEPTATERPSCADRYPANGPGGVDLQLGCVAAEIVGGYTNLGPSKDPERMSTWLLRLGAFTAGLILLVLALGSLNRRLNRRMASAVPASWWSCPRCRSLNADHVLRCYACGEAWTPAVMTFDSPASRPRDPGPGRPAGGA